MLSWIILTLGVRCKKPADRYLFLPGSIHRPTVHLTCEHLEQQTKEHLKAHIQYLCMSTLVHIHIVLGYPTSQYSGGIQGQENLSRHNLILCLSEDLKAQRLYTVHWPETLPCEQLKTPATYWEQIGGKFSEHSSKQKFPGNMVKKSTARIRMWWLWWLGLLAGDSLLLGENAAVSLDTVTPHMYLVTKLWWGWPDHVFLSVSSLQASAIESNV